jgi:hypothetical protein
MRVEDHGALAKQHLGSLREPIEVRVLASGKGKRHEHAAPVRRGGAGQFEFGTTAASTGILQNTKAC